MILFLSTTELQLLRSKKIVSTLWSSMTCVHFVVKTCESKLGMSFYAKMHTVFSRPPNTHGGTDRHPHSATVSMIHGIPELRISRKVSCIRGGGGGGG